MFAFLLKACLKDMMRLYKIILTMHCWVCNMYWGDVYSNSSTNKARGNGVI